MTPDEYSKIMAGLGVLVKAVAPLQWDNFLVATGQAQAMAPTTAEVANNPGKFYGTRWDILEGTVPSAVVNVFLTPEEDAEGNKIYKFVEGTLYDWAKADLDSFLQYFRTRYKVELNMAALHPAQKAKMGL